MESLCSLVSPPLALLKGKWSVGNSHVLQSVLTDRSGISVTTRSRVLCPEQTDEASQEGTLNLDATFTNR